jgi:hypothetical protein
LVKYVVITATHTSGFFGGTATVTDQESLQKNALCDLLMREGIDGRQDADAVARTVALTDLAIELGRKDGLACALAWYEALEKRYIRGGDAILLDYCRANAVAGDRYGTQWKWEQPTLAREMYYLRRAVSNESFAKIPDIFKCQCLNNLGNRLEVAGRSIEALDCWRRVLEVCPNFGMSLCNRAAAFVSYGGALEDRGMQALFFWMAHREASAALAPSAVYTAPNDRSNVDRSRELKKWIESFLDIKGIAAADPLTRKEPSAAAEERDYQQWCLANLLYLDPMNDLGPITIASSDSIGLGVHVVPVDEPHRFESFFDQMKQEYVSARWLLYEGLTVKKPHFSDRDVLLQVTEPRPSLSLAVEKLKIAYRTCYSLFDKVAFFTNAYMELGIPENKVSFRTLWRPDEKKPIRKEFDSTTNWGFCALYWLAKDFFEKENDEVAEPQARRLSEVRNYLEHKYLRVTAAESPATPPNDLAMSVSRAQFEAKTLHLIKLARSALIYLTIAVRFEEQRREPGRIGLPLEEIPLPAVFPDADKL